MSSKVLWLVLLVYIIGTTVFVLNCHPVSIYCIVILSNEESLSLRGGTGSLSRNFGMAISSPIFLRKLPLLTSASSGSLQLTKPNLIIKNTLCHLSFLLSLTFVILNLFQDINVSTPFLRRGWGRPLSSWIYFRISYDFHQLCHPSLLSSWGTKDLLLSLYLPTFNLSYSSH